MPLLLFGFILEYSNKGGQEIHGRGGLVLNGFCQLMVYANEVGWLEGINMKKKTIVRVFELPHIPIRH